ncbi:hypothetical protein DFH06DRAFT_1122990 [Mycena polygramma]|nr:hypothetical protein DFH06DRAFT_1122990 [Mycena polygramma]
MAGHCQIHSGTMGPLANDAIHQAGVCRTHPLTQQRDAVVLVIPVGRIPMRHNGGQTTPKILSVEDFIADVLSLLTDTVPHVERLAVNCNTQAALHLVMHYMRDFETLLLHHLSLAVQNGQSGTFHAVSDNTPLHWFARSPSIVSVSLHGLRPLWGVPDDYRNVSTLALEGYRARTGLSWDKVEAVLRATTRLANLRLGELECARVESGTQILLPHLTELSVSFRHGATVDAIRLLVAPRLRTLTLDVLRRIMTL